MRTGTLLHNGALALWLAAAPAACYAHLYDEGSEFEVAAEPPPPRYEVVPAPPYYGAVWIGGRWMWRGRQYVWLPGRYVRPRPGYVYQPHVWTHAGPRWRYTPGRWHRR